MAGNSGLHFASFRIQPFAPCDSPSQTDTWQFKIITAPPSRLTAVFDRLASVTGSLLLQRPQPAFSLAEALTSDIPEASTDTQPPKKQLQGLRGDLQSSIRRQLQEREPQLFEEGGKAAKMERIIAKMADKQAVIEARRQKREHRMRQAAGGDGPGPGPASEAQQAEEEGRWGPNPQGKYDRMVQERLQAMLQEMDPKLREAVEKRRDRVLRKTQGKPSKEDLESLPLEEVERLFGREVAQLVRAARERGGRFRQKLGRLLAGEHMKEQAAQDLQESVVMGDAQHLARFKRMLRQITPPEAPGGQQGGAQKAPSKPVEQMSPAERLLEAKRVRKETREWADRQLSLRKCAGCRRAITDRKGRVTQELLDCPGCHQTYHVPCLLSHTSAPAAPSAASGSDPPASDPATGQWYHSGPCLRTSQALQQQLQEPGGRGLKGRLTLQLLPGGVLFQDAAQLQALPEPQREAMQDAFEVLEEAVGLDEAMVATSADYGALLRHRGRPVGAAALTVYGPEWAQLLMLAVKEDEQGKGHAKALVEGVEGALGQAGVRRLVVMWPRQDAAVMRMCKGVLGFRDMGRRERQEFSFLAGVDGQLEEGELREAAFLVKPLLVDTPAGGKQRR